jgi:uncharacterized membrane protein
MRTFWKVLAVSLMVIYFALFLINFSMYWWPDMPTSPGPAKGRIYPLNNHGHYTYMNEREHRLNETWWMLLPLLVVSLGLIIHFIDPFDEKRKHRYGSPPPGFR